MCIVVGRRRAPKQKNRPEAQTKESARRDKRPPPGYCVTICFYYAALGHMFVLVGCGRGAQPYVSIMRRWTICLYWLAVGVALGHMFLLCVCMCICVCVYVYMYVCMYMCVYVCMYVCVCVCVCVTICFHRLAPSQGRNLLAL